MAVARLTPPTMTLRSRTDTLSDSLITASPAKGVSGRPCCRPDRLKGYFQCAVNHTRYRSFQWNQHRGQGDVALEVADLNNQLVGLLEHSDLAELNMRKGKTQNVRVASLDHFLG